MWYLDPSVEHDIAAARTIARALRAGRIEVLQPPHWLAEVAAVTARLFLREAEAIVDDLCQLELETATGSAIYQQAVQLAVDTGTHVFDALYHAVALGDPAAIFVTADKRYYKAARRFGQIVLLDQWRE
jgi:predicted nucleic acid-binding protein